MTLGAPYIDYIIADRTVIPDSERQFYTEQVVILPNSYQVNDSRRPIAQDEPGRGRMRPARERLCLLQFQPELQAGAGNVRALDGDPQTDAGECAVAAGGPSGIRSQYPPRSRSAGRGGQPDCFCAAGPNEDHLARLKLADLFLDTLPCNAHTTASDALWAGLPLLTCRGGSFSGRVAASLLGAVGLPELVTETLDAYEAMAVKLVRDPVLLSGLRERLANNRLSMPLFDTARYCRHLEARIRPWSKFTPKDRRRKASSFRRGNEWRVKPIELLHYYEIWPWNPRRGPLICKIQNSDCWGHTASL